MSRTVAANIDAYGRHAQASALADYVELLAINGVSVSPSKLADFITDADWVLRPKENFVYSIEGDADNNDPTVDDTTNADDDIETADDAARVYALLQERAELLGATYPFELDEQRRLRFTGRSPLADGYLIFLAITVAHAHEVDVSVIPTTLFQFSVTRCFRSRGWLAEDLRELRDGRTFDEAIDELGRRLRVPTAPTAVIRSGNAQDAGVDCIAHYPWCVGRAGRWMAIGQATCAKSNEWRKKLFEPAAEPWRLRLGEAVKPKMFLAVPHHAEPFHREYLFFEGSGERFLLDRIALAKFGGSLTALEEAFLLEVMSANVESPS